MVDLTGEGDEAKAATRGSLPFAGVQRTDTAYYAERQSNLLSLVDHDRVLQQPGPSRAMSEERVDASGQVAPSSYGKHREEGTTSEAGPSETWVSCSGPAVM